MNIFRKRERTRARRMAELEAVNRDLRHTIGEVRKLVTSANGHPHGDKYMVPAWMIREALEGDK